MFPNVVHADSITFFTIPWNLGTPNGPFGSPAAMSCTDVMETIVNINGVSGVNRSAGSRTGPPAPPPHGHSAD